MEEVATGAKGTNAKGSEGTTGDVPATPLGRALLGRTVDKQAATAVVAVASIMVAAAQLSLVLGVAKGNVELVETMGKLAALSILAETSSRVAGAKLCLVSSGADPGDEGWGGGLYQGKQCLGE